MTVLIPKKHTLVLDTKQIEELLDLVANELLVEIPDSKKKAKSMVEKTFLHATEMFYSTLYEQLNNALTERDD
jgi:hypothetical protein